MNAQMKPKFIVAEERYSQSLQEELMPLLKQHWSEIALYQGRIPLDVNWEAYRQHDSAGKLVALTARREGVLIGYSVFYLARSHHYQSTLSGINDVLYVAPEFRNSRVGLELIRESERAMKARNVVRINWHVKFKNADGTENHLSRILVRRGYQPEDLTLGKLL